MERMETNVPTLPGEEWKKAKGVPGVLVSNMCRCYRESAKIPKLDAERNLKLQYIPGGIVKSKQIHVNKEVYNVRNLVASTWLGPMPLENLVARFRDGNEKNAHVDNLVWAVKGGREKIPSRCFEVSGRAIRQDRGGISR